MPMQVAKWGNSLAVRLPRALVEALGLKEGDQVDIRVADPRTFEVAKAPTTEEIVQGLRTFRGRVPVGYKFSRLDAYEHG
ncbi:MAG: AbrB/MazE/SpoVT family DNA-binding domain-containing protein [Variibacter sp.]